MRCFFCHALPKLHVASFPGRPRFSRIAEPAGFAMVTRVICGLLKKACTLISDPCRHCNHVLREQPTLLRHLTDLCEVIASSTAHLLQQVCGQFGCWHWSTKEEPLQLMTADAAEKFLLFFRLYALSCEPDVE